MSPDPRQHPILTRRSTSAVLLALGSVICVLVWAQDFGEAPTVQASAVPSADRSALPEPEQVDAPRATRVAPDPGSQTRPAAEASPAVLGIPSIGVSTPLLDLGIQPDGTVEVPGNPDLAGWFEPGTAPGAVGSSVILGHVDSEDGPAVFARLGELAKGDVVWVGRADGTAVRFVVRTNQTYARADFPARRIYAAPHRRRVLSLITCGGAYDSFRGGYQANVVVHARRARRV